MDPRDGNGNTVGRVFPDGSGNTFEWDAANRLIAINYTGTTNRTEFTYDGLSHRKKIVEKSGATVTSTKQFVWIGNRIAEERDDSNVVTRRYFANGEERTDSFRVRAYFYTKDHLGSIRELTDSDGSVRARYDYDPFGTTTTVSGDLTLDFGYTGHYRHAASNLYLAPFRAYDPTIGRWINRDPIAEFGGINLYGYVENSLTSAIAPLGLDAETRTFLFGFSYSYHVDGTPYNPGDDIHEKQHRDDWWNNWWGGGPWIPGWQIEQRAYSAEAEYLRHLIAELRAKKCLTDSEKKTLEAAELELLTAEKIANSEAAAKDYWNREDRHWWQPRVK
jgi:RHS repeat-associated protein